MLDQLFEVLGTYESNLAEKTPESKKPRFIKALLTSTMNQITTLLHNAEADPRALPKGSRTSLQKIRRVMIDIKAGIDSGNIGYKELRATSRDIIGVEHAKLVRFVEAAKKAPAELEFEEDDTEPMAASAVVKVKRKQLETLIFKRYTNHLNGKPLTDMAQRVHAAMDSIETRMTRMSDSDVKKIDLESLVKNHTLDELLVMSEDVLRNGTGGESDELKELVASYKKVMGTLPSTLHSAFQAFEFPVVPLFTGLSANAVQREKFVKAMSHAGVKVRMIGDHYPVFEKQYLLALDCGRLGIPKGLKTVKGGATKTVNSKDDNGPGTIVGGVLDTINKISPIKFVPASTQLVSNPRNPDIKLMWIVTEKVRVAIGNALHTSEAKWGLPADIDE